MKLVKKLLGLFHKKPEYLPSYQVMAMLVNEYREKYGEDPSRGLTKAPSKEWLIKTMQQDHSRERKV